MNIESAVDNTADTHQIFKIAGLAFSLFIFIAGYEIVKHIFASNDSLPHITPVSIFFLICSTLAVFGFGQYALHVGKKTRSPALIAEGRHRQVDVLSSIVVLLSVLFSYFDLKADVMGISIDQLGAALILFFHCKGRMGAFV